MVLRFLHVSRVSYGSSRQGLVLNRWFDVALFERTSNQKDPEEQSSANLSYLMESDQYTFRPSPRQVSGLVVLHMKLPIIR
jgi:hypothetical protein